MLPPLLVMALTTPAAAAPAASPAHVAIAADHSLGLAGAPNFRDLGGYQTADGHTVRRGLVYRSSKLETLTQADWSHVRMLGIGHVYDLRTIEERTAEPDDWPAPAPPVYGSPKPDLNTTLAEMKNAGADAAAARATIERSYTRMPAAYAPEYAALFHGLAAGDTPVVVHCTAGKDRTGVASALLLTALGVPRATVVDDYEMTERLLPEAISASNAKASAPVGGKAGSVLATLPPDVRRALWRADPLYIGAALDAVDRDYGSIDGYMHRALGMDDDEIARLRQRLVQ